MSFENTALYEAVVSNQQLFLHQGNPLCTRWLCFAEQDLVLCHGMGEISSARQVQKSSEAGHLIDHLAWRFPLFSLCNKIPTPIWNPSPAIPRSLQARSVTVHPVQLSLHQLRGRKQTLPPNTSTLNSIQTEGPGIAVLRKDLDAQAKAMGHQGSPLTEATSDGWGRLTLVYRPSCPGYFTAEPEPVPSPEPDSTDELTYNIRAN